MVFGDSSLRTKATRSRPSVVFLKFPIFLFPTIKQWQCFHPQTKIDSRDFPLTFTDLLQSFPQSFRTQTQSHLLSFLWPWALTLLGQLNHYCTHLAYKSHGLRTRNLLNLKGTQFPQWQNHTNGTSHLLGYQGTCQRCLKLRRGPGP